MSCYQTLSYNQTLSLYDPGYCVEPFFINASIYIKLEKLLKEVQYK